MAHKEVHVPTHISQPTELRRPRSADPYRSGIDELIIALPFCSVGRLEVNMCVSPSQSVSLAAHYPCLRIELCLLVLSSLLPPPHSRATTLVDLDRYAYHYDDYINLALVIKRLIGYHLGGGGQGDFPLPMEHSESKSETL